MTKIFALRRALAACLLAVVSPGVSAPRAEDQPGGGYERGSPDRGELASFAEESFAELPAGGAVLVFVQAGRPPLLLGFGTADADATQRVDPRTTLFYIGSVTKVFTATLALQLVEEGKLDLRRDVNAYLDGVTVPETYSEPITLAHLLTHTAGFDDRNIGYVSRTAEGAGTTRDYLARELPARVRPPGRVFAYSNHGYGLIGHLIERVTGTSFAGSLEERIFRPLRMDSTTAIVPPPGERGSRLAAGFDRDSRTGVYGTVPLGYRKIPGAGSISTTGADMARFLAAHLGGEGAPEERILAGPTLERMHARQFSAHPAAAGIAFGLFERYQGGLRLLEHRGAYLGYTAHMVVSPEGGFGLFVAANRRPAGMSAIVQAFLDRFYPVRSQRSLAASGAATPAASGFPLEAITGTYHSTRYSRNSIEKIAVWDAPYRAEPDGDDAIRLKPRNGRESRWLRAGDRLFRSEDGRQVLAAGLDDAGRVTRLALSGDGTLTTLERLRWNDDIRYQLPVLFGTLMVAFTSWTLWPIWRLWSGWRRRRSGRPAVAGQGLAACFGVAAGLLQTSVLLGIDAFIGNSTYRVGLIYGMSPEMIVVLWTAMVAALLSLLVAIQAIRSWARGYWSLPERAYFALLASNGIVFVLFLLNWNLLGFRY